MHADLAPETASDLLEGAYDLHVHFGPDLVPRAQDALSLARDAAEAKMAGVVLKDHAGETSAAARLLESLFPGGPRFFSSATLNWPLGAVNPLAAEAALRRGAAVVFFPTYAAAWQLEKGGPFPDAFPRPEEGGVRVVDCRGRVVPEAAAVIDLIVEHDAVLATGHLAPNESLALLARAAERGARRMLVTHASEPVPDMAPPDQARAVELGALVEHSLMALTDACGPSRTPERLVEEIRFLGPEHVVLSSDFGQPSNGPPVAAFRRWLERLTAAGLSREEIRVMVRDNPVRLLEGRRGAAPAARPPV